MQNTERSSYDVRSEKLKISEARSSSVAPEESLKQFSSDNRDVSEWIQNVRALKDRRREEDYARNRQLEEDILRERKARQERRAVRSRSASPVKESAQSTSQVQEASTLSPLLHTKDQLFVQLKPIISNPSSTLAHVSSNVETPSSIDSESQDCTPKSTILGSVDAASRRTSKYLEKQFNSMTPRSKDTCQQEGSRSISALTGDAPSSVVKNSITQDDLIPESPTLPAQGLRNSKPDIATISSTFLTARTNSPETSEELLSNARLGLRNTKILRSPTSDSIRNTLLKAKTRLKSPTRLPDILSLESSPPISEYRQPTVHLASQRSSFAPDLASNARLIDLNDPSLLLPSINPTLGALLSRGTKGHKSTPAAAASATSRESSATSAPSPISSRANSLTHATRSRARRAGVRPPKTELVIQPQSRLDEDRKSDGRNVYTSKAAKRDALEMIPSSPPNAPSVDHNEELLQQLPTTFTNHQSSNSRVTTKALRSLSNDVYIPIEPENHSSTTVKTPPIDTSNSFAEHLNKALCGDTRSVRSYSPFQKAADNKAKSSASKSTSSMSSFIEVVRSRAEASREQHSADLLNVNARPIEEQTLHSTKDSTEHSAGFVHAWRLRREQSPQVTQDYNRLGSNEILLLQTNDKSTWFKWIGKDVTQADEHQIAEIAGKSKIIDIHFGEESPDFVSLQGGLVVSTSAVEGTLVPLMKSPRMLSVRKYQGGFAIDEQSLAATTLCSGFVYLVLEKNNYYVWLGKGSYLSEKEAAMQFIRKLDSSVNDDKISEILEGDESIDFWALLGGKRKYASSSYWKLRPEFPMYRCDLYTLETNQRVVKHKVWSRESIHAHQNKVHIIDVFFEMYIILTEESNALTADIHKAISWCKHFSLEIGRSRPFLPMVLILCPGSKYPRDLRACFRDEIEDKYNRLKVIEGSTGESLLKRNIFSLEELQSGTVLGINACKLDEYIAPNYFSDLMGVTESQFRALSDDERRQLRGEAKQHLT